MKKFLTLFAAILLFGSMTVKADFYVAGTFNDWNAGHSDYKMSGSGPYSVTKQLNSGDYQFKITSGSWSWSTNAYDNSVSNVTLSIVNGNIAFSLTTICDVTFYYNASTGKAYVQASPATIIYTVAGSGTLLGSTWDPSDENNEMTLVDGLYTWSKENVVLEDDVEFKVVLGHSWGHEWPASNYKLNISEAGIYTVTITFEESEKIVNAVATKTGEAGPIASTYTVAGDTIPVFGTSWDPTNENNDMTLVGELYTWVKEDVKFDAGDQIKFKVCKNHAWDNSWPTNDYVLTFPEHAYYTITITFNESTKEVVATAVKNTYTVAGYESAFGSNWDQTDENNDMIFNGEVFTYVKSNVNLSENIKFKVCKNHAWTQAWPADDYELAINEAGLYNINITFDPSTTEVTANAVLKKDYTVAGSEEAFGSSWNPEDENNDMTQDGVVYTLVRNNVILTEAAAFKVCKNHAWTEAWPSDNYQLPFDGAGVYTIGVTFNESTKEVSATATKHTYTAAGSSSVFGSSWNVGETNNDMTFDDVNKVFTWQKENVTIEDDVELKVVLDHDWSNGAWPVENYELDIPEVAIYTVTVTFNPSTSTVSAEAVKTGEAGPVAPATYTVAGYASAFGSEWDVTDENNDMTLVGELYTLVKENLTLDGDVKLKVVKNHSWDANWPEQDYVLAISEKAVYTVTVTFNESTKDVSAEAVKTGEAAPVYETVRGSLTAGKYYTLCYNKTMTAIKGASLWSFAGKDAGKAFIVEAEAPYVAGTPYLIYAESDKLEALTEEVANPSAGNHNGLYGTFTDMTNQQLIDAGATYMLKDNEIRPLGGGHLNAYRAYIILSEITDGTPSTAPGRRVRAIPMQENTATDLEGLEATDAPVKVLIDGQIYILRGEKMFDTTGRMVK